MRTAANEWFRSALKCWHAFLQKNKLFSSLVFFVSVHWFVFLFIRTMFFYSPKGQKSWLAWEDVPNTTGFCLLISVDIEVLGWFPLFELSGMLFPAITEESFISVSKFLGLESVRTHQTAIQKNTMNTRGRNVLLVCRKKYVNLEYPLTLLLLDLNNPWSCTRPTAPYYTCTIHNAITPNTATSINTTDHFPWTWHTHLVFVSHEFLTWNVWKSCEISLWSVSLPAAANVLNRISGFSTICSRTRRKLSVCP